MQKDIVIVAARRTALGGFQGALSTIAAPDLGSAAIAAAVDDAQCQSVDNIRDHISEVYMGCVLSAGLGQAPARQAALAANIAVATPATTVNKVCGSGMKAIMLAADQLQLGRAQMVVAGGMESMSNAPYLLPNARSGLRMGHQQMNDHIFVDGLQDAHDNQLMGMHAQRVADEKNITRAMMDDFALRSLERAQEAARNGWFESEIIPVTVVKKKHEQIVDVDEQPMLAKPEKIPTLRPAFDPNGSITAANASSIADGAAAILVTSRDYADSLGIKPIAKIVAYESYAREPEYFTCAPVGAINALLMRQQLQASDIDLLEINEAFAMVPMLAMQSLGFTSEQVNISGGACALGHPLGASGCRIVVTLIHNMQRLNKKRGIASLCIGGGEATAMLIELL